MKSYILILGLLLCLITLSGCIVLEGVNAVSNVGSGYFERKEKQRILERVARDWCLTIRASQVVPIYPLQEDFEVGDCFVVNTPITKLKGYWNQRGYLPIETTLSRFQPTGYDDFYRSGYGLSRGADLPRIWQFPNEGKLPSGDIDLNQYRNLPREEALKKIGEAIQAENKNREAVFAATDWPKAPGVGFPSYTFNIRRGESFNGALPLQSVPVMLGALGGRKFTGSVSLSDAYSYGIDDLSLIDNVRSWAWREEMRDMLAPYATTRKQYEEGKSVNYLRVVTRVFLVKSVAVSLADATTNGFKVSAGSPKDDAGNALKLGREGDTDDLLNRIENSLATHQLESGQPGNETSDPAGPIEADLKAENERLKNELMIETLRRELKREGMRDAFGGIITPGGTLSLSSSSESSISMIETFRRPLVVGYHALEFAIGEQGVVDPRPTSTIARVTGEAQPPVDFQPFIGNEESKEDLDNYYYQNVNY